MTSEASSTAFGFPTGQVSFIVEDWQLSSFEVAELVVGHRSTVPLAFAWIGGVSEGSSAPELRPAEVGSYLVTGVHSADDEDEFLEILPLPCPLIRDQRRGDPMGRPALTGTPVSGRLMLVIPDGWADGWDEWMQGAPSPWPMFEIEVQAIRTCQYSGRSVVGTGDSIERSGTSLGRDLMIEGRLISLRPGDVDGYRRHPATRNAQSGAFHRPPTAPWICQNLSMRPDVPESAPPMPPLWFGVEEWQIESGEVPLYAVGETVGLLPQFRWIGHPEEKTADPTPYVRHHTLDRLDVCLPQRITATGEVYVELGGEVWDTLSGVREVQEGVVLEGSMILSVAETDRRWSNELFAGWTIQEIREVRVPCPDEARLDELAVPVQRMTDAPGRFYFLRCTPEPSYAVGLTEDEAHELAARVRRTAGFTAKIRPVRTYFSVSVTAPLTRWHKKKVVLYEEAHWESLLEDLPRFRRMHAAENRSRRAQRWRRLGVRRGGRYAG